MSKNKEQNLPYNPELQKRATALRKAGNLSEVLLWNQIKNKKFKGLNFDRQKVIGNYIVDFFCVKTLTVIEIDGNSHDYKGDYDVERDKFLKDLGLNVVHIPDKEIKHNLDSVMKYLEGIIVV